MARKRARKVSLLKGRKYGKAVPNSNSNSVAVERFEFIKEADGPVKMTKRERDQAMVRSEGYTAGRQDTIKYYEEREAKKEAADKEKQTEVKAELLSKLGDLVGHNAQLAEANARLGIAIVDFLKR